MTYLRRTLKESVDIDATLTDLCSRFPSYYDNIIDMYIVIKEKITGTYSRNNQYQYDSDMRRRRTQQDIYYRLINNHKY